MRNPHCRPGRDRGWEDATGPFGAAGVNGKPFSLGFAN